MEKGRITWHFATALRMHRTMVNREADAAGVYMGQHHLLVYIARHPGCSQSEIAEALEQSPAAVSLATKRLQELGLITKYQDEGSLRVNRLAITEMGDRNGEKFREVLERYDEIMFSGFSDEELQQLDGYIDRMTENLKTHLTPDDVKSMKK